MNQPNPLQEVKMLLKPLVSPSGSIEVGGVRNLGARVRVLELLTGKPVKRAEATQTAVIEQLFLALNLEPLSCRAARLKEVVRWTKDQTQAELLCEEMNARPGFVGADFDDKSVPMVDASKTYRWSDSLSLHACHDGSKFVFNSATRPGKQFSASPNAICWGVELGEARRV